jgi:hypothetical protein
MTVREGKALDPSVRFGGGDGQDRRASGSVHGADTTIPRTRDEAP